MCKKCLHKKQCKARFGKEYSSVVGTHLCRQSWQQFLDLQEAKERLIPQHIRGILSVYPELGEEYKRTGSISVNSILSKCPRVFKNEQEVDDLLKEL
jgi:hypothetical protein